MDAKTYLQQLKEVFAGEEARLYLFEQIDSTNTYAKTLTGEMPAIVIAAEQTAGRGRRENVWSGAAAGEDLYISFYVPCKGAQLQGLTLTVALAVHDVLLHLGVQAKIKWPNDIYIEDKKACGILCEAVYQGGVHEAVVIGIGINGRKTAFAGDLAQKAISLYAFVKGLSIPALAQKLNTALKNRLSVFFEKGFAPMAEAYTQKSYTLHKQITVAGKIGTCVGFTQEGALLLKTEADTIETIVFGTPAYL